MANRLSVIATRTGDDGTTGLGTVPAAPRTPRVAALGDVDELNSAIGLLLTETLPEDVAADLLAIQHDLFDMGAELCIPGHAALKEEQIARLGAGWPLQRGAAALARVHPARRLAYRRACARGARDLPRAERAVVALARTDNVNAPVRQYLNRLSDLLFVLARHLSVAAGKTDVFWSSSHSRQG